MHKKSIVFILGLVITAVFFLCTWDAVFKRFGVLTRINYIFYDVNLKIFHKKTKSDHVILVDVDEKSLQAEGRWPWPRSKVAAMVKNLQDAGASVIVFDILFPEPEANIASVLLSDAEKNKNVPVPIVNYLSKQIPLFDNDKIFAEAISNGDVVLGVFFSKDLHYSVGEISQPILNANDYKDIIVSEIDKYIGNIPILAKAAVYSGFTSTMPDEDGIMRRSPLLIKHGDGLYSSLALEAVRAYLLIDDLSLDLSYLEGNQIFLGAWLGDIYIPTDSASNVLITYRGGAFSFPYVSITDVINKTFEPGIFEGKIVLIGSSAVGIGDVHSTPLHLVDYPGAEVHATIISSFLDKDVISSPLWLVGIERILISVIGLIFTILAAYLPALGLILLALGMLGLMLAFNAVLLVKWSLVLPHLMLPFLQILFLGIVNSGYGYLFETRYRRRLHSVYGQYVSSAHIDKMVDTPSKEPLAGHSKVMTVLFADVKGFTSISEKLSAKEVKKFLNILFTPLTALIFEYKGTIDKYVGDMIVAFWNDPIDDEKHAEHCVRTAIMMQKKIDELAPAFSELGLEDVGIRIGINTGRMHVGDMGSEYRKAYTVLGDSVNLGSRLEGVNKMYGTKIMVSQDTKDMCEEIVFRFVDAICVKGKVEPTNIYEPICFEEDVTEELKQELAEYNEVIDLYKSSEESVDWRVVRDKFAALKEKYPDVELYAIYLKRVKEYELSPPPCDWDRAQHLTAK